MGAEHAVSKTAVEGYSGLTLSSPAGVSAVWVPAAGMVCCSLTHGGDELLGQREGLRAYAQRGSTMGIPILHPWANRLDRAGYEANGTRVDFPPDAPAVRLDGATGLPIHGLISGWPEWEVTAHQAGEASAWVAARLDVTALPEVAALFPFDHELALSAELSGPTLTVTTILTPSGERPVPVAFGFHPYLRLPGVRRQDWRVGLPVTRHAILDERNLPTGRTEPVDVQTEALGDRTYDDLFPEIDPRPVFTLEGGGRRVSVGFERSFDVAVVYAPSDDDVICFEPMTAPTNPFADPSTLRWVDPGMSFRAAFSITVEAAAG